MGSVLQLVTMDEPRSPQADDNVLVLITKGTPESGYREEWTTKGRLRRDGWTEARIQDALDADWAIGADGVG